MTLCHKNTCPKCDISYISSFEGLPLHHLSLPQSVSGYLLSYLSNQLLQLYLRLLLFHLQIHKVHYSVHSMFQYHFRATFLQHNHILHYIQRMLLYHQQLLLLVFRLALRCLTLYVHMFLYFLCYQIWML